MQVSNIHSEQSPVFGDHVRLSADISYRDRPNQSETLWFDVPGQLRDPMAASGDPWLAAMLPLASKLAEPLHIEAPVDPILFESARELVEWWQFWFPAMKSVSIDADVHRRPVEEPPSRTAQFFSGGVDSFFTLLRHSDALDPIQIDDLLFVWGFDIPLSDRDAFDRVRATLAPPADRFGKQLVTFSTNIRETRFGGLPWGTIGHGSAMAAAALLLQPTHRRVLIPSTDGYRETGPWGSHVVVDHLHSSSTMRLIHDGAAFSRMQKVALVATSPEALAALHVCWRSRSDKNCGKCEKCLRTMIALELCDVLVQATTFAHVTLDLDRVSRIHCPRTERGSLQLYYLEMLAEARRRGRTDLARALSWALSRSSVQEPVLRVLERLKHAPVVGWLARPIGAALSRSIVI